MKKAVYLVLILLYAVIGTIGMIGGQYVELGANNKLISTNWPLMLLVTLIVGTTVSYFFTRVYPKGYSVQKKAGKIAIPVIFFLLSFVMTIGVLRVVNTSFPGQEPITVDGFIVRKWSNKSRKSSEYFLSVRDLTSKKNYEFRIKRKTYEKIGFGGNSFKKEFYKGSLGIIYRNQE
ncbi:MAG: hypothetical protein SGI83_02680 [Bacteroidota bacterium]|nr:hypothetical protein [Bacteroidota bacterium]